MPLSSPPIGARCVSRSLKTSRGSNVRWWIAGAALRPRIYHESSASFSNWATLHEKEARAWGWRLPKKLSSSTWAIYGWKANWERDHDSHFGFRSILGPTSHITKQQVARAGDGDVPQ